MDVRASTSRKCSKSSSLGITFSNPNQRYQNGWKCASHSAVAFILNQHQGAGFSNGEIDPGDAHVSGEEHRAQALAGNPGQLAWLGSIGNRQPLTEGLADLFL